MKTETQKMPVQIPRPLLVLLAYSVFNQIINYIMNNNAVRIASLIFCGMLFSLSSSDAAAKNYKSLISKIESCSAESENTVRLECFDKLSASLQKEKSNEENLPDNLGGGKFDDNREESEGSSGVVKSCKKSYDGKWFFIFESGQVWKQVDKVKRRYKDCKFNVTITRDGFGYKMRVEDDPRIIRIKRHK